MLYVVTPNSSVLKPGYSRSLEKTFLKGIANIATTTVCPVHSIREIWKILRLLYTLLKETVDILKVVFKHKLCT